MSIDPNVQVRLSSRDITYLKSTNFLPPELAQIILSKLSADADKYEVILSQNVTDKIREALTERLAKVGFDSNYQPTAEGKLLEELIDRFGGDFSE
jgi:hypothetical protein